MLHRGWLGGQPRWRGRVIIRNHYDEVTGRATTAAMMDYCLHQDKDELGILYDARVVQMSELMILMGYEREPIMNRDYVQNWELRPITQEEFETPISADVIRGRGSKTAP